MADEPRDTNKPKPVLWAQYSELAFTLPACVFVGWVIGALADRGLGTRWGYLVGLGLGFVAGFVQVIRAALRAGRS